MRWLVLILFLLTSACVRTVYVEVPVPAEPVEEEELDEAIDALIRQCFFPTYWVEGYEV